MSKTLADEEYFHSLPRKTGGSAVLFFNTNQDLLIVKPDYRDGWLIPGGSIDENESPLACAVRETQEEIGLTFSPGSLTLVGVHFGQKNGIRGDSLKFVFNGGVLSEEMISQIVLQTDELEKYEFLPIDEALPLLSSSLQACLPDCIAAISEGRVSYTES